MTASTVGGASTSYAYDGADLRVSMTASGVTSPQLWDRVCSHGTCGPTCGGRASAQVPLLVDDSASAYLWADGLVGEVTGATRTDALTDALGSVRARTDATGAITSTADYDAFGGLRRLRRTTTPSAACGRPRTRKAASATRASSGTRAAWSTSVPATTTPPWAA
jgi:YD repeat-containing protein